MTNFEAITDAISQLPPDQIAQLRVWLNERAEVEWDERINRDSNDGKLDRMMENALEEHRAKRTRPL